MRVVQLQRRTFAGHFSVERAFAQVRLAASPRLSIDLAVTSHYNRGVLPRLATVWEARGLQGDVTHITGDINYAALLTRRRSTILTVLDTEFLDRAAPLKRVLYRMLWLQLPVWRAGTVTVISRATADDLHRHVRVKAEKVRVLPVPVGPEFAAAAPVHHSRPIVLIVGTRPNKNVARAAAALRGVDCDVVVVGELDGAQEQAFADAGLTPEVRTGVPDSDMPALYRACDVLLFPSTKEGFGIPILEAQAVGRPVVTSDLVPMSDVAGGGACLVDPLDPGSIRAGLERVLGDDAYRASLVQAGRLNAARYRPEAVAAMYCDLYEEVARRP